MLVKKIISTVYLLIALVVAGCGGENGASVQSQKKVQPMQGASNKRTSGADAQVEDADLSVLFIGNSHAAPIPSLLGSIFATEKPAEVVRCEVVQGFGFLSDHANRPATLKAIESNRWDYVVLQAQKYSTTGKYTYPIDGAIKLANLAKVNGAKVIMFPEWSRKAEPEEYKRINKIHIDIASQTGTTVAPVGAIWASALERYPNLEMYSSDGNHASRVGAYLNACIFYRLISGAVPASGPDLMDEAIRQKIHEVVGSDESLFTDSTQQK